MSQSTIWVSVSAPPRAPVTQPSFQFFAQRFAFTIAWGSAPSSGTIDYVSTDIFASVPVAVGALVKIEVGGHLFWGICQGDAAEMSSGGRIRTLTFIDVREFLQYDIIYGVWNVKDARLIGGRRFKWYKHLLPVNYNAMLWTYSTVPYKAAQIIDMMLKAPTVQRGGTPWIGYPHPLQNNAPAYDVDCFSGKTLQSALQEVTDKQGLVFGLTSTVANPYILSWIRKGESSYGAPWYLPTYENGLPFPLNSDDRRISLRASGAAERVRVLGGRNLYQVSSIELVPDWPRVWDQMTFGSEDVLLDFIYHNGTDPETKKKFTELDNDPDHFIGALRARVYAEGMTVRGFVEFLGTIQYKVAQADFIDTRLFHGRLRMDMPVFIYLREIVYRAFALPTLANRTNGLGTVLAPFQLINVDGNIVPLESLHIADHQLTRIVHDPATGLMTAIGNEPVEGNGYCVTMGCRIESFANANPETFDIPQWKQMAGMYQQIQFRSDDSGMGTPFILLDEPVFVPTNLFMSIPPVPRAGESSIVVMRSPFDPEFRLDVPIVAATLVFEAEVFSRVFPPDSFALARDVVVNVSQLNAEYYLNDQNRWTEIPFADDLYAGTKAWEQAAPLLGRPYAFAEGGYTVQGSNRTPITSLIDRVTIESGPDGMTERVEFTKEATGAFESERDLDRRSIQDNIFPGQLELTRRMREEQVEIKALRQSKQLYQWLSDSMHGIIGRSADLHTVQLFNTLQNEPALKVGTPLWRSSTAMRVVPPVQSSESWSVLAGATVRENESAKNPYLRVQRSGVALLRVAGDYGDVHVGDTLVQVVGKDYLAVKIAPTEENPIPVTDKAPIAGTAQGLVAKGSLPTLIWVHLGASGGTSSSSGMTVSQFKIKECHGDYLVCERLGWSETGAADTVNVAKSYMMRISPFGGSTTLDGYSYQYGDKVTPTTETGPFPFTVQERKKSQGGEVEEQIVTPTYHEGYIIYAVKGVQGGIFGGSAGAVTTDPTPIEGGGVEPGVPVEWMELSDGRAWAQRPPPDV